MHAKSQNITVKDERQLQAESLVVSVPLPATVPGINLPTSSSNNNSNNISTIVTSSQSQQSQQQQQSTASPHHGGTLFQHLTNNNLSSHRSSPLITPHQNIIQQHSGVGRQSPHTSTLNDPLPHRSNTPNTNNHQSVLQNLSSSPSVISNSITESTSTTGMLKITYEKQSSRVASLMQEEAVSSGRRSRYIFVLKKTNINFIEEICYGKNVLFL